MTEPTLEAGSGTPGEHGVVRSVSTGVPGVLAPPGPPPGSGPPPPPPVTSSDGTEELSPEAREAAAAREARSAAAVERSRHRRSTGPGRTWLVAGVAVLCALAIPIFGLIAGRTIANSREGRAVEETTPIHRLPSTPAALLVTTDRQGAPAGLTVFSVGADGRGGTVLIVPLGTAADLDGPGAPARVDVAWGRGGLDAQTQAVEGLLGIGTSTAQAVDEAGLAELLEPLTPVDVTFDSPVLDTDGDGVTKELFPAGDVTLSADDTAKALTARVDGESEVARLPRQEAVWTALAARSSDVASSTVPTSVDAAAVPSDLPGFLTRLAAGPVGVHALRVQSSFDAATPAASELLQPDGAYLRLLVASVMPGAVSPANGNITFRVVNPLGDPNLSYAAVGRLAAVQANVVLVTDTTDPAPDQTTMVWHSPAGELQAATFAPVLGSTAPTASTERIDGVDATVVLGRDFPGFLQAEEAKSAATSTTTSPPTPTTVPAPFARFATTTTRRTNR